MGWADEGTASLQSLGDCRGASLLPDQEAAATDGPVSVAPRLSASAAGWARLADELTPAAAPLPSQAGVL